MANISTRRASLLQALLVEILVNNFCPTAVVPALQLIWFYNTQSDVWYEHFLIKRSDNNKPSRLIIRCVVSCILTLLPILIDGSIIRDTMLREFKILH